MKFLIPVIAGATIGYGTNWLAIKMLFRPYEEKRFLGIKVPWTPGLIPKEKPRIAKNVGLTVQDYLLSPEAILSSIDKETLERDSLKIVTSKLNELEEKETTVGDILKLIPNKDLSFSKLKSFLISDVFLSDNNKNKILKVTEEKINNILNDETLIRDIVSNLKLQSNEFINSEDFFEIIKVSLKNSIENSKNSDKLIEDLIPEEVQEELFIYLRENKNLIGYKIRKFTEKPEIQMKTKEIISNFVQSNISPLIASFMPIDMITNKVLGAINSYIKSSDANDDINEGLNLFLNDFLKTEIKELDFILKEEQWTSIVVSFIKNLETENLFNYIELNINQLNKWTPKLLNFIREFLDSKKLKSYLSYELDNIYNRVSKTSISSLLNFLDINPEKIVYLGIFVFENNIIPNFPKIIKHINVSNIVEQTILDFDYEFTEKLILDIAEKELKAITYLGGFLGAILGFLSALIQF